MSSDVAIKTDQLSKIYPVFDKPIDRLKQFFWRGRRQYYKAFTALEDVTLELNRGEILGIVGRNGSGKSTLLQLICNTLSPTSGELLVDGRIAALLELGAGFNPEFSGRENIFLNASILGLEQEEIEARYAEIVEFSEIAEFIDQPVKTYSSGMFVRLAFSVAISVDPDILIIDEALSVGDGAFAKKSFDRIMDLKRAGKTILFCSHSMYQIEALCNRVLWLDKGRVQLDADPGEVVVAYNEFLDSFTNNSASTEKNVSLDEKSLLNRKTEITRFTDISIRVNKDRNALTVISQSSELSVRANFKSDKKSPSPSIGVAIFTLEGKTVASLSTHNDGYVIERDEAGNGKVEVLFPNLPLLKGTYYIDLVLACDQGLHMFEHAVHVAEFQVHQTGLEQGIIALQHEWK